MLCVFSGQLVGTAVGNRLFAEGGWVASGSASVGFIGLALMMCFVRGPWEKGWFGWGGGWSVRRRDLGGEKKGESSLVPAVEMSGQGEYNDCGVAEADEQSRR